MNIHCKYDELIDPRTLKDHPKNRNKHSADQIERLAKLYSYHGVRHPIIVSNKSHCIVAGHGRKLAAIKAGIKEMPVVFQDFDTTEAEYAFIQADNAIALWAELDLSAINMDIGDLGPNFDIDLLGIKDFVIEPADKFQGDEDAVPEVKESICKLGDLWVLGNHRLLCGDSTVKENIDRLMNGEKADMVFTDPPYGMNLETDYTKLPTGNANSKREGLVNRRHKSVIGDNKPFDPAHLLEMPVDEVFIWGGDYFAQRLPDTGSWICWDKTGGTDSLQEMFGSAFELCWSKQKHKRRIARVVWKGVCGHIKKDDGDQKVHPTMKPVKLAEWFFNHWGKETKLVWDGYLGSGSTLIACEKTQRKCYGMEIDPHYCDVIIKRWETYTGKKACLVQKNK